MNRPVHVKVPVVIQLEALECGAAALCMILAYYGRWIPLERVREDCGVSRDGSNLKSIYLAASSYGMNARAFRYSAEQLRTNASIPCIVHWENNHFVVLDGFKGDYVYLNDPSRGTVRITFTEFKQSYSGVCMFLEPAENFVKGGKPDSILKFARQRLKGTLPVFALIILTTLITHLRGILTPLFSRFFVDYMLDSVRSYGFFVLFGLVGILQFVSLWIKSAYMLKLQGKMAAVANTSFMWHILRLPLAFFEQRMAGDIALRQQSNQEIAAVLINTFAPLLLDAGAMILNLLLMLSYSPLLAAAGLVCVACNLVLARIISQRRINITRVQMRDKGKLDSATMAGIDMIETIKSSGAENSFFVSISGFRHRRCVLAVEPFIWR